MKKFIYTTLFIFFYSLSYAQNVGIGTTTPHPSAKLEISSHNSGILIPRMSSEQRKAIASPETGLLVFDYERKSFMYFDGGDWVPLVPGSSNGGLVKDMMADSGESTFKFGYALSIHGDYAAISSLERSANPGVLIGSVYIFHRNNAGNWIKEAKLSALQSEYSDWFGVSTDIEGDYLIVGAPFSKNTAGAIVGVAYIFKRTGTSWSLETTLRKTIGYNNEYFGYDVAISASAPGGISVVVGVPKQRNILQQVVGGASVFTRNSSGEWLLTANIISNDFKEYDYTGLSVDIEGNLIVMGAPHYTLGNSSSIGMVYFYRHNGNVWLQEHKEHGSIKNGGLGVSVSISGGRVAAGEPYLAQDDHLGRIYFFYRHNNTWMQKVLNGPRIDYGYRRFGMEISLKNDYLLVGAPGNRCTMDLLGINYGYVQGKAYLYKLVPFNGGNNLIEYELKPVKEFGSTLPISDDHFAQGIALSEDTYIIGDPFMIKQGGERTAGSVQIGSYD